MPTTTHFTMHCEFLRLSRQQYDNTLLHFARTLTEGVNTLRTIPRSFHRPSACISERTEKGTSKNPTDRPTALLARFGKQGGHAEDTLNTQREVTEDLQTIHRHFADGPQGTHRGSMEDSQRICREVAEDSQRLHRRLTGELTGLSRSCGTIL